MSTQLDKDELFHLALHAINQQQHPEAIELLKRALSVAPEEGRLHYLLGAEYAQIGLYDRAVESMSHAVTLDPALHLAAFQLGLLHLTQGQPDQAASSWEALATLPEEDPLFQFSTGLKHLAKDEFDACKVCLEKGMALNQAIPALNHDMQQVLDQIAKLGNTNTTEPPASNTENSVFIKAYTSNPGDDTLH